MFKAKYNVIIDIGSYSLCAYAVDVFDGSIKQGVEKSYSGYQDGEWIEDADKIRVIIYDMIDSIISSLNCKIRNIYVGVPGEFVSIDVKETKKIYPMGKSIVDKDIDDIYAINEYIAPSDKVMINCSPVYFTADNHKRVANPVGEYCNELKVLASYSLCDKKFFDIIGGILSRYTKGIKFVPTCWAEALSLVGDIERDAGALICDVGYISSSVMHAKGDGLLALSSISLGGAYIASDLMQVLKVPFEVALKIKPMIDFSLQYAAEDVFDIVYNGAEYEIKAAFAREVAIARVEDMAESIKKIIEEFQYKPAPYLKLYLTGGSLAEMRGATNIVSNIVGRSVEVLTPTLPQYSRPRFASLDGIYTVQRQEKSSIGIKNLFGFN